MTGLSDAFTLRQEDGVKFLACQTHIGAPNADYQMENYVFKRRGDGMFIIDMRKTWEKILLAARAIAAVENPADVCVISARPYGQRAILKFAAHTGATAVAGRFTPGTFTNQIQSAFREPRLLIVTDPRTDHQAVTEASYVNIPVIAFCNTDSPLKLVDIAIPCNNKGQKSIGLMWWMLAREVLIIKGKVSRELSYGRPKFMLDEKEVMVDLYFYRDPEEQEKEEMIEKAAKEPDYPATEDRWATNELSGPKVQDWDRQGAPMIPAADFAQPGGNLDWAAETQRAAEQWGMQQPNAAAPMPVAPQAGAPQMQPPQGGPQEDWGAGGANW